MKNLYTVAADFEVCLSIALLTLGKGSLYPGLRMFNSILLGGLIDPQMLLCTIDAVVRSGVRVFSICLLSSTRVLGGKILGIYSPFGSRVMCSCLRRPRDIYFPNHVLWSRLRWPPLLTCQQIVLEMWCVRS